MGRQKPAGPARNTKARPIRAAIATNRAPERRAAPNSQPSIAPKPASGTADPQALVVSHWFDSGDHGEPYTATVRLTGRRVGASGRLGPGDTFAQEETVDGVVPGTGPVSLTTWVYGVAQAEWEVTAELVGPPGRTGGRPFDGRGRPRVPLPRAAWSWRRWALTDGPAGPIKTRWALLAPLAPSPAVLPGAFTALAVIAIVVAVVSQAAILAQRDLAVEQGLLVTALALVAGLLGAKFWYMALKARPWRETIGQGWSVDGFLVAAPIVAIMASLAVDVPIGSYLDATAPGIFLAVAIGRVGCFVTGCCAGRCTVSRWGVWSSDRRVGARRIPTQLLESSIGMVLGVVSVLAVVNPVAGVDGASFVITLAIYGLARQFLLRLRAEARPFSWRRGRLATQGRP